MRSSVSIEKVRARAYTIPTDKAEEMLFEGAPIPKHGVICPDFSRPGNALEFKQQDAARYAA